MSTEQPTKLVRPLESTDPADAMETKDFHTAAAISGFSVHSFEFFAPHDANHLLPGREMEQTQVVSFAPGSSLIFALMGFDGAFVDNSGGILQDRELGQFYVWTSFRAPNLLVCRVRLTAENIDQPVSIKAKVVALIFS